jgi:hypothetical protein
MILWEARARGSIIITDFPEVCQTWPAVLPFRFHHLKRGCDTIDVPQVSHALAARLASLN